MGLKQFSVTSYYRNVEVEILCVSKSVKEFSEVSGFSTHHISKYAHKFEPRDKICVDNPNKLFGRVGLGGEARIIFKSGEILPLEEYKARIDEHRKIYSNYNEYINKNDY
jgi:cobalamin biosynthesis Co2+ chelatase CbiK